MSDALASCGACGAVLEKGSTSTSCPACGSSVLGGSADGHGPAPDDPPAGRPVAAENELVAGRQLADARFTLVRRLGRGGMGEVWLATDANVRSHAGHVALKFLSAHFRQNPQAMDLLREELEHSRRLSHKNILRVHDLQTPRGEPAFMVMEYVEGATLQQITRDRAGGRLDWEELRPLFIQLCSALEYAHDERVVHSDLKPGNLLIDRLQLKLADFGLARLAPLAAPPGATGRVAGTPEYMSPQQMRGDAPTVSDDIYALGATLYELLTGTCPLPRGADFIHRLECQVPERLTDRLASLGVAASIPGYVEDAVAACLDKEPARRPPTVVSLARRLKLPVGSAEAQGPRLAAVTAHGSPFSGGDLSLPGALADTLRASAREIDRYIANTFSPATQALVSGPETETADPDALRNALVEELNRLLSGPPIYEAERFAGITLRAKTWQLLAQNPRGEELRRLNRLLLEDAYPLELRGDLPPPPPPGFLRRLGSVLAFGALSFLVLGGLGWHYRSRLPDFMASWVQHVESRLPPTPGTGGDPGSRTSPLSPGDSPTPPSPNEQAPDQARTSADLFIRIGSSWGLQPVELRWRGPSSGTRTVQPSSSGEEGRVFLGTVPGTYAIEAGPSGFIPSHKSWINARVDLGADAPRTFELHKPNAREWEFYVETGVDVLALDFWGNAISNLFTARDAKRTYYKSPPLLAGEVRLRLSKAHCQTIWVTNRFDPVRLKRVDAADAYRAGDPIQQPQPGWNWTNLLGFELVWIDTFWVAATETTIGHYRTYAQDRRLAPTPMLSATSNGWQNVGRTWQQPGRGFDTTADGPVVGVSWNEAVAFCEWLTERERGFHRLGTNQAYRLPTDAEWSRLAALAKHPYPWGNDFPPPPGDGNYSGQEAKAFDWDAGWPVLPEADYLDRYARTAPVRSGRTNFFGLFHVGGNLAEWCADPYVAALNPPEILADDPGLVDDNGGRYRVIRGASWYDGSENTNDLRTCVRRFALPTERSDRVGFRIVLSGTPDSGKE